MQLLLQLFLGAGIIRINDFFFPLAHLLKTYLLLDTYYQYIRLWKMNIHIYLYIYVYLYPSVTTNFVPFKELTL